MHDTAFSGGRKGEKLNNRGRNIPDVPDAQFAAPVLGIDRTSTRAVVNSARCDVTTIRNPTHSRIFIRASRKGNVTRHADNRSRLGQMFSRLPGVPTSRE